jgi:8-oxo-dGTP pyrophosphatase MutT (NUDIX family)
MLSGIIDKEMKKKVTAAVVIINRDGAILGCHGTGKPRESGFDFPKGLVEENETDIQGALRELREETGLVLSESDLLDCGVHKHNKEKDIHIFLYQTDYFPGPWKCNSFFELNGHKIPEVDSYMVISKNQRGMFNKVLQDKFEIIDSFNSDENRNRN